MTYEGNRNSMEYLSKIFAQFPLNGDVLSCERYGQGHINVTYLVVTNSGCRYILQKINHKVFPNVDGLMRNMVAVTDYLREKVSDPRGVLPLIRTNGGDGYLCHTDGTFWRAFNFIENGLCLQSPETPEDFYESAVAFGNFQQQLKDFPAETLCEVIPNFHNTADRYRLFREALEKNAAGRAESVQAEISFALAREQEAGTLVNMLSEGKLPLRVTHNDTKLNNVMLDATTRKALCVMDLDTVMPGLSLYDFGDSIRFGAATAAEDEKDLSKVEMDLAMFEIFTKGYLTACPGLTEAEREMMPMGAKLMTLECGVRFLTDYLNGDVYFQTHYPEQNLDRCRTQFKLVQDMEGKWNEMTRIVREMK